MEIKEIIAGIIIGFHLIGMTLLVWVPFFISTKAWPTRLVWHFIFLIVIMVMGITTALIHNKKYNIKKYFICPLNLITQRIRGYKYNNPKNYNYSHIRDLFQKLGIKLPIGTTPIILSIVTILSLINLIIYFS